MSPSNTGTPVRMVVPCFNEYDRWQHDYWNELLTIPDVQWIFVDDGSTDATGELLDNLAKHPNCVTVAHDHNKGKAEAVRTGLLHGLTDEINPGQVTGFVDADGSFSVFDIQRLIELSNSNALKGRFDALWSARVPLSGREISRSSTRSFAGRLIRWVLRFAYSDLPFDTQVGFKLFYPSAELLECLQEPFVTHWFFDVELLIRWRKQTGSLMRVWEEPLTSCLDIPRSRIAGREYLRIIRELLAVLRTPRSK